jgi:hypothetical protein
VPHRATLAAAFPEAVTFERYMARVERALAPYGFDREHTFAAVSICRDELTQSLLGAVAHRWDQPFSLGGLGARPALGRTGWRAALSHVPCEERRGHLVVFGFPHIGIDPEGVIGASLRRHQHHSTPTCGAMASLLASLSTPPDPLPPGLDDHEADRLRGILDGVESDLPHDLLSLTRIAARAVDAEMWTELEALQAYRDMDVAVFTGVQVHLPDDVDHIWPSAATLQRVDGARVPLEL